MASLKRNPEIFVSKICLSVAAALFSHFVLVRFASFGFSVVLIYITYLVYLFIGGVRVCVCVVFWTFFHAFDKTFAVNVDFRVDFFHHWLLQRWQWTSPHFFTKVKSKNIGLPIDWNDVCLCEKGKREKERGRKDKNRAHSEQKTGMCKRKSNRNQPARILNNIALFRFIKNGNHDECVTDAVIAARWTCGMLSVYIRFWVHFYLIHSLGLL